MIDHLNGNHRYIRAFRSILYILVFKNLFILTHFWRAIQSFYGSHQSWCTHLWSVYTSPTKTNYALNFYGKVWEWWLWDSNSLGPLVSMFKYSFSSLRFLLNYKPIKNSWCGVLIPAWSCHLVTFISHFSLWSTVGRVPRTIPNYTHNDLWMLPLFSSIYVISWVAVEACRSCLCTSYFVPFRAF